MTHMDTSIFPEPSKFDPSIFEKQIPSSGHHPVVVDFRFKMS